MANLALDVTVKALLVVALAQGVALLLRRSSSATRHLVWTVAAAGLLVLPLLSLSLPRWSIPVPVRLAPLAPAPPTPAVPPTAAVPPARAATPIPPAPARPAVRASAAPEAERSPRAADPAAERAERASAADPGRAGAEVAARPATAGAAIQPGAGGPPALLVAWLLGAVAVLAGLAVHVLRVRRLEKAAHPIRDGRVLGAARRAVERIGAVRRVRLLESAAEAMPMTWGVRRPVLLLPAGAGEWPEERLEAVLLHELAHVQRRDHLWQYVAELACALHWFNPAAWLVARRLRVEREHACDDAALAAGSVASTYAAQLLEVARSLRVRRATSLAAMAMARPSHLTGRLLAVLDERRSRSRPTPGRRAATLLVGAGVIVAVAAATPAARAAAIPAASPAAQSRSEHPAPPPERARLASSSPAADWNAAGSAATARAQVAQQQAGPICGSGGKSSISIHSDDGDEHIKWKTSDCDIEVWTRGEVRLRDDLGGIESVAPGGSLKIEAEQQGTERKLEVTSEGGRLRYAYQLERREHAFDADAQRWLQSLLVGLARETGWHVEQRISMLLRRGGPDAVIAEADQIGSDYVAGLYLKTLLDKAQLTDEQLRRIADEGARDIASDYELAELLIAVSGAHPVDASLRPTFLRAAGTLQSDYEHARVLKAVLGGGRLSSADVAALLASAGSIGSDYERTELLVKTASRYRLEGAARAAYLDAVKRTGSDYERGRALKALLAQGDVAPAEQPAIVDAIGGIGSDYEVAEALIAAVPRLDLSQRGTQDSFVRTAARIESDYEHARVLKTLAATGRLQAEPLAVVLVSARGIRSDYELAELLVLITSKYRITGPLREAFLQTLKGISPGYEHDRVAAALLDNESG